MAWASSSLGLFFSPVQAQPVQREVPESVRLYQQHEARMPRMEADGKRYGGLSICKLLDRPILAPQPFFALPSHLGEDTCDLSNVVVAYGGWCTAGVEDPSPVGPHFSQSLLPSVEVVVYTGTTPTTTVVFFNNYLKSHVRRTPAGEAAAVRFFRQLPPTLDVRSAGVPIFPAEYLDHLPPRKDTR